MALLTPQDMTSHGLNPTYQDMEDGGDTFENSISRATGVLWIAIKNRSGGAITVNAAIVQTVDGQPVVPLDIAILSGKDLMVGPFNKTEYGTVVTITASTYAGVTIALIQV